MRDLEGGLCNTWQDDRQISSYWKSQRAIFRYGCLSICNNVLAICIMNSHDAADTCRGLKFQPPVKVWRVVDQGTVKWWPAMAAEKKNRAFWQMCHFCLPFTLAISLDCTFELFNMFILEHGSQNWMRLQITNDKPANSDARKINYKLTMFEILHVWSPRAFLHRWPKVEPLVEESVLILSESHSVTAS